MPTTKPAQDDLCAWRNPRCYESRVSGSEYCEDHVIQAQVTMHQTAGWQPSGDLAADILRALGLGFLKPVSAYTGA